MENQENSNHHLSRSLLERGIQLKKQSKFIDAIEEIKKAAELNPYESLIFFNIGHCFHLLENFDEAIHYYKVAIDLDPSDSSSYNNLGCCLEEKGLYEEAIANYSIAIRHNSNNFDIYMNRGDMRMKTGDYYGAISDYSFYQKNFATSPTVYVKRGLANLKANFKEKAYNDLKMAEAFGSQEATRIISEQNLTSSSNTASTNNYQRDRYSYQSLNESIYQRDRYSYQSLNESSYQRDSYQSLNEARSYYQRNSHESIRYQNHSYLPRYFSLAELYKNAIKDLPNKNEIQKSDNKEINPKAIQDKNVVITGTIPGMNRKEVEQLVKKAGGNIKGSISSTTNLLIAGEDAGSKLNKAKDRGIQIVNIEELNSMIAIKSNIELLHIWKELQEKETFEKLKKESVPVEILKLLVKCNINKIRRAALSNKNITFDIFYKSSNYGDSKAKLCKFFLQKWGQI